MAVIDDIRRDAGLVSIALTEVSMSVENSDEKLEAEFIVQSLEVWQSSVAIDVLKRVLITKWKGEGSLRR